MTFRLLSMSILCNAVLVSSAVGQPASPLESPKGFFQVEVMPTKIDAKAPIADLLPARPKDVAKAPAPFNSDLRLVPEIIVGQPVSKTLPRQSAIQQTADIFARISFLDQKKKDGFMLALLENRREMQGLPFQMGDACHTDEAKGRIMPFLSKQINDAMRETKGTLFSEAFVDRLAELQTNPMLTTAGGVKVRVNRDNQDAYHRALVATLVQVLGPEDKYFRIRLAKSLATIPHVDATRAMAQLAIFAPEESVREAAIAGLKLRRERDYTEVLLQGFRYPLPDVAQRSAEALVKLERKDLLADLVGVLEKPDPRMPAQVEGKETIRELVRVNHHHNCVLCHAPAVSADTPAWALKASGPLPTDPFPGEGGYMEPPSRSVPPQIFVRIDMTYLRQDFSQMMPVANASPWPNLQRFDFFVRTREVSAQESQAWQTARKAGPTPYQQAAVVALRGLTGRDAEPTAQAWREVLKTPRQ